MSTFHKWLIGFSILYSFGCFFLAKLIGYQLAGLAWWFVLAMLITLPPKWDPAVWWKKRREWKKAAGSKR